jgi:MFS family permease
MADRAQAENFVQRHFRWNFATNLAETTFCMLGYGLIGYQTFLPVFLSQFTDSRVLIGLVGTAMPVGWLLPQLFVARWIESLAQKKPVVVRLAFAEKMLYLVLAGLAFLSFRMPPGLLVALFVGLTLLIGLAGGVTRVGWGELIASIFPPKSRGDFFGLNSFLGGLLGALGAYLGGLILARYETPDGYALSFFLGFCVIILSWTFLLWTREPPSHEGARRPAAPREYFGGLADLLRGDSRFAQFVIAQGAVGLASMGVSFVAVFGEERFQFGGYGLGVLSMILLLGGTLTAPAFGWFGGRVGHRKVLIVTALCQMAGLGLAAISRNVTPFYIAVFLLGAGRISGWVNVQPFVCDYAPIARRPTYIGLSSTALGLVNIIAPVVGGVVAQALGYGRLFAVSAVLSLAAVVLFVAIVREPDTIGAGECEIVEG